MKCRECKCCHDVILSRWDYVNECWRKETVQQCWGVKEPFIIRDINTECTEYPDRRDKKAERSIKTNADNIRSMTNEELGRFLCNISKCESCQWSDWTGCLVNEWLEEPMEYKE